MRDESAFEMRYSLTPGRVPMPVPAPTAEGDVAQADNRKMLLIKRKMMRVMPCHPDFDQRYAYRLRGRCSNPILTIAANICWFELRQRVPGHGIAPITQMSGGSTELNMAQISEELTRSGRTSVVQKVVGSSLRPTPSMLNRTPEWPGHGAHDTCKIRAAFVQWVHWAVQRTHPGTVRFDQAGHSGVANLTIKRCDTGS